MPDYYVNKNEQNNGDHKVHVVGCAWLDVVADKLYLGDFLCCHEAVVTAQIFYPQSNGCYYCSRECHTP